MSPNTKSQSPSPVATGSSATVSAHPRAGKTGSIQKTTLATLIALIAWAGLTHIDESVSAGGQIVTPARMQTVQSQDGGFLSELHVTEGQHVRKGDLLAVLGKERAQAATQDLRAQYAALHLAHRRAVAQATGQRPVADASAAQHPALWQNQLAVFDQQQRAIQSDLTAFNHAIELARAEHLIMEKLQASGDISETELMRSQRSLIELRQRRDSIELTAHSEARKEAARLASEMESLAQRIRERQDVLQRTDLHAPMDGIIHSIRLKTIGAVLRPGDEFLQITPALDPDTLELRVSPSDIGRLKTGQHASVKLDAWDYSIYGALDGEVVDISPDTVTEQGYPQPQTYYRVQVKVHNKPENHKLDVSVLKPGMRANADILTGQRSLLWYLTSPITRAFGGALKER